MSKDIDEAELEEVWDLIEAEDASTERVAENERKEMVLSRPILLGRKLQ
jgi:hypothetical protein